MYQRVATTQCVWWRAGAGRAPRESLPVAVADESSSVAVQWNHAAPRRSGSRDGAGSERSACARVSAGEEFRRLSSTDTPAWDRLNAGAKLKGASFALFRPERMCSRSAVHVLPDVPPARAVLGESRDRDSTVSGRRAAGRRSHTSRGGTVGCLVAGSPAHPGCESSCRYNRREPRWRCARVRFAAPDQAGKADIVGHASGRGGTRARVRVAGRSDNRRDDWLRNSCPAASARATRGGEIKSSQVAVAPSQRRVDCAADAARSGRCWRARSRRALTGETRFERCAGDGAARVEPG